MIMKKIGGCFEVSTLIIFIGQSLLIILSFYVYQRLEVQADVASAQRFSMSSETASAATSLSEKSVSASIADDGAASTRALAGSVLNFRMDSSSLSGFRGTSADACTPVEVHTDSASQRSDDVAGPASLSSLEELTTGMMRRTRRRPPLDRQVVCTEVPMKNCCFRVPTLRRMTYTL